MHYILKDWSLVIFFFVMFSSHFFISFSLLSPPSFGRSQMARQSYRATKGDSMGVFLEMVVAGQVPIGRYRMTIVTAIILLWSHLSASNPAYLTFLFSLVFFVFSFVILFCNSLL